MSDNGTSHGDDCSCTRCTGFPKGHDLSIRHGAYASPLRNGERAQEIADVIRSGMPLYSPADETTIALLASTLVRVERSAAALDRVDETASEPLAPFIVEHADKLTRLRDDHARWIGLARKLASDLGLSPASRSALGLRLAHAATLGARVAEEPVDLTRLSVRERVQLEQLVERATGKDSADA